MGSRISTSLPATPTRIALLYPTLSSRSEKVRPYLETNKTIEYLYAEQERKKNPFGTF